MSYLICRFLKIGTVLAVLFLNITDLKAINLVNDYSMSLDTTEVDSLLFLCDDTISIFGETFSEPGIYEVFQDGPADMDTLYILELVESGLAGFSVSPSDTTVCFGESVACVLLDSGGDTLSSASSINWYESSWFDCDTCFATSFQGLDTMEYSVEFLDANGCLQSLSGTYISERDSDCFLDRVSVPNAFRPNSVVDDANKTFGPIYFKSAQKLERMSIYNRWGELVYETGFGDTDRGVWDGNINLRNGGIAPAPMDVYYYDLVVFCPSVNKNRAFRGELMLIR